eukprot:Skav226406  [mRNA]  locus=scaffold3989:229486:235877:- [translate_table: standard]
MSSAPAPPETFWGSQLSLVRPSAVIAAMRLGALHRERCWPLLLLWLPTAYVAPTWWQQGDGQLKVRQNLTGNMVVQAGQMVDGGERNLSSQFMVDSNRSQYTGTFVPFLRSQTTGWPRQQMNSVAEVELLSQVAAMLMPEATSIAAIPEMFRNFPAPEGWGGHYLEPDLSLYGVLKNKDAALFVEYDGFWRHETKEGIARDEMKNAALLAFAPSGSYVIRISHATSKALKANAIWMKVDTWPQGDAKSLQKVLMDLVVQIRNSGLSQFLHPRVAHHLKLQAESSAVELSLQAHELACSAVVVGASNTSDEIGKFLAAEGYWIAEVDLDGYRLTAASHVTADFTAYLSTHLRFYASALGKENFFIVGEATTPFGESYLGRVQGPAGPKMLPKMLGLHPCVAAGCALSWVCP